MREECTAVTCHRRRRHRHFHHRRRSRRRRYSFLLRHRTRRSRSRSRSCRPRRRRCTRPCRARRAESHFWPSRRCACARNARPTRRAPCAPWAHCCRHVQLRAAGARSRDRRQRCRCDETARTDRGNSRPRRPHRRRSEERIRARIWSAGAAHAHVAPARRRQSRRAQQRAAPRGESAPPPGGAATRRDSNIFPGRSRAPPRRAPPRRARSDTLLRVRSLRASPTRGRAEPWRALSCAPRASQHDVTDLCAFASCRRSRGTRATASEDWSST